ncbi:MAG: hypothetical protein NZ700_12060 [Gemmataceae bacterium]|nr:hypothetical protein [Gemmataceae bacterium]MDW8266689.1 hypothetical protein [Gemmataceae bacterium]
MAVLSDDTVRRVMTEALAPAHFFVGPSIDLEWSTATGEEVWEVFQGRLLDAAQTRQRRFFVTHSVFLLRNGQRSAEPLLSLKWDVPDGALHVVRAILCYAWEGYHAGHNVYLSRETTRWVRELVGTVSLENMTDADMLRAELTDLLFRAVVGTSRLPLTSWESPVPEFALGQLAYVDPPPVRHTPLREPTELLPDGSECPEHHTMTIKRLEAFLRSASSADLEWAAERMCSLGWKASALVALYRGLFLEVSLSPYTEFVDNALRFLDLLARRGGVAESDVVDFLSWLLRQLGRHLTAYDLTTFHHRGANYPDALLLDAALKAYLGWVERRPDWFLGSGPLPPGRDGLFRRRRRALRQACLLRRWYEGHPVPDAPTSPGENQRILPPPYSRVPDEQIFDPTKRTRKLYQDDPLDALLTSHARHTLEQSLQDLDHPEELRELGMALFLDRPLGGGKPPATPDLTPLLTYEAFSRAVADARLRYLTQTLHWLADNRFREHLANLAVNGIALRPSQPSGPPRIVSLLDAWKSVSDFLLLRTTRRSLAEFMAACPAPVIGLPHDAIRLIVRADYVGQGDPTTLWVYDQHLRRRAEWTFVPQAGYARRGIRECPVSGLQLRRAWD